MKSIKTVISCAVVLLVFSTCANKKMAILNGRNFDQGDWLLLVQDATKDHMHAIDDEAILKDNPFGLLLSPMADCGGTTCDGFIKLYKDGELMEEQEYLSSAYVIESSALKVAYKNASGGSICPDGEQDFKLQWDSLSRLGNLYPTRYHTQPDDKDIIWYYKIEE